MSNLTHLQMGQTFAHEMVERLLGRSLASCEETVLLAVSFFAHRHGAEAARPKIDPPPMGEIPLQFRRLVLSFRLAPLIVGVLPHIGLRANPDELGDAANLVPVGDINAGASIHINSMRRAEGSDRDIAGRQRVVCPLRFLRIVP
jgi:hypothetical protein